MPAGRFGAAEAGGGAAEPVRRTGCLAGAPAPAVFPQPSHSVYICNKKSPAEVCYTGGNLSPPCRGLDKSAKSCYNIMMVHYEWKEDAYAG